MNFEPFDNSGDDVVAPDLSSIMDIVARRQRRRYQMAGAGVLAGLAATGAVLTDVFQRGSTTVENIEAAGQVPGPSDVTAPPSSEGQGDLSSQAVDPDTPDTEEQVTSTTAAPTTTVAKDTTTTESSPALCPAPNAAMDEGAWIGRGLTRFSESTISQEDAQTLADSWVIPLTEAQALLGLGSGSGVDLMRDLGAIEIWDNWAADYQVGETLGSIAEAWNSTSISVKALYLIGEPAAVEAVTDCPPAGN